MRINMIQKNSSKVSLSKQFKLLYINRSSYYYRPKKENEDTLKAMKLIDQEYLKYPFYGSRQMKRHLNRMNYSISRNKVRRLMRNIGITAIYRKPRTSIRDTNHKIYPYLLFDLKIDRSNRVWCSDITYIPLIRGFLYLTAIKDWYSRKVLSWKISNTLDSSFCVSALEEAIYKYGIPQVFNTDQGSQYTSNNFIDVLKRHDIQISMDGKGRYMDNIFIERLWRSLKHECVYLQEYESSTEAKESIGNWIKFYNEIRPHSTFGGLTPNEVYIEGMEEKEEIAA